ncbi:hypothetical protein GQR58_019951 [Nymphon striatum]|nr:hypothetical protein GQR58_019951 [Nymphon striatum]
MPVQSEQFRPVAPLGSETGFIKYFITKTFKNINQKGPTFRRYDGGNLVLHYTDAAQKIIKMNKSDTSNRVSTNPHDVHMTARQAVIRLGGDLEDETTVLGQYIIQFGQFRGQSFLWMLENVLDYCSYLVDNLIKSKEVANKTSLSINKFLFSKYFMSFAEGQQVVEERKRKRERELASKKTVSKIPARSTPMTPMIPMEEMSDDELLSQAEKMYEIYLSQSSEMTVTPPAKQPSLSPLPSTSKSVQSTSQHRPPLAKGNIMSQSSTEGWRSSLPKHDQSWISKALFKKSSSGKAVLDMARVDRLWYYPPQPACRRTNPPKVDPYFAQKFLLWMPRKLWNVRLVCIQKDCNHELTGAGIYKITRTVFDIDSTYNMATEYLECAKCKKKYSSWSLVIVKQLTMGQQLQFPVIVTYKYACDIRVIRLLRQRGMGNSTAQMEKKLTEQHGEVWMKNAILYLTHAKEFIDASAKGLIVKPHFDYPPVMTPIVKKLAGKAAGTANWCTNVGNQYGQVLMSVLTATEGGYLQEMVDGVSPASLLYVDRDCCPNSKTYKVFSAWPHLIVRLDIWHFMRRISDSTTTDCHPLYASFMSRLSGCIFVWSDEDMDLLVQAKRSEMEARQLHPSDEQIHQQLTKKELSLHCRRTTRGEKETTDLIYKLLLAFEGVAGLDTLGVPLLDKQKTWQTWNSQKRHIRCIQDPKNYPLYTKTGYLTKGGIRLPVYRCSRGSTGLESFHLHINRFVPGNYLFFINSSSDMMEEQDEEEDFVLEDENENLDEGFEEIDPTLPTPVMATRPDVQTSGSETETYTSDSEMSTPEKPKRRGFLKPEAKLLLAINENEESIPHSLSSLNSSPPAMPVSVTPSVSATPSVSEIESDNAEGLVRVDKLAEFMVSLCNISNERCTYLRGLRPPL